MVGLVGGSNNPVSGMAIATLLIATLVLKTRGNRYYWHVQRHCHRFGYLYCCRNCWRYVTRPETGFLLGATPKKQQIGEIIGVIVALWRSAERFIFWIVRGALVQTNWELLNNSDEADYRRRYGRKSSVGACVYRCFYCCVGWKLWAYRYCPLLLVFIFLFS